MDDWRHEWEIDPATLEIGPKVGEGEFGTVHKVCWSYAGYWSGASCSQSMHGLSLRPALGTVSKFISGWGTPSRAPGDRQTLRTVWQLRSCRSALAISLKSHPSAPSSIRAWYANGFDSPLMFFKLMSFDESQT